MAAQLRSHAATTTTAFHKPDQLDIAPFQLATRATDIGIVTATSKALLHRRGQLGPVGSLSPFGCGFVVDATDAVVVEVAIGYKIWFGVDVCYAIEARLQRREKGGIAGRLRPREPVVVAGTQLQAPCIGRVLVGCVAPLIRLCLAIALGVLTQDGPTESGLDIAEDSWPVQEAVNVAVDWYLVMPGA